MARLTFASLESDLKAYGISLTGKSGLYTVVLQSGFSTNHRTLIEVLDHCQPYMFFAETEADVEVVVEAAVEEEDYDAVQSTRVNQLASYYLSTANEDLDWLSEDISMAEQEEKIGAQLVREADERKTSASRSFRSLHDFAVDCNLSSDAQHHNQVLCLGFGKGDGKNISTARVNNKLQRRANRLHSLLA
jgi:hypothetical protein